MNVNRRALSGALQELVRVAAPKASLPVLSHVLLQATAGVLTLRATDLSRSLSCQIPAEVVVPVLETSHEGDDLVLGFNPTYLSDALGSSHDAVTFGMSGPTDAVRLNLGEGRFAVIMPMRL